MTLGYPQPWCPTCALQRGCSESGSVHIEYPACHQGIRGLGVDSMRRLARWLCEHHRAEDPRLQSVFDLTAELLQQHGLRYSEIFEPSLSVEEGRPHLLRFSYAFPGYREQPEDTVRSVLGLCRPFGEGVGEVASRVARAMEAGCVEQPIFGLDYRGLESWRVKLYLQFRPGCDGAASGLAARILGARAIRGIDRGEFHLLGLDTGAGGVIRAKLYFRYPRLSVTEFGERFGHAALGDLLRKRGVVELKEVLGIHHLVAADAGEIGPAMEVDLALRDSGLLLRDLEDSPWTAHLFDRSGPVRRLFETFPVAVRRVSVAVRGPDKLNLYYMLTG